MHRLQVDGLLMPAAGPLDKGKGVPHQAVQIQAQVHQVQEDATWEKLYSS